MDEPLHSDRVEVLCLTGSFWVTLYVGSKVEMRRFARNEPLARNLATEMAYGHRGSQWALPIYIYDYRGDGNLPPEIL